MLAANPNPFRHDTGAVDVAVRLLTALQASCPDTGDVRTQQDLDAALLSLERALVAVLAQRPAVAA